MEENPLPAPDARAQRVARRASGSGSPAPVGGPAQAPILAMPQPAVPGQEQFAAAAAAERGAKRVIPLDVSGAFHCSLMDQAAHELKSEIDKTTFYRPQCPLICNVDAKEEINPQSIKNNLVRQVNSATYWEASMKYLLQKGVLCFFEIGPGMVLKGLFKKIDPSAKVINIAVFAEIKEVMKTLALN